MAAKRIAADDDAAIEFTHFMALLAQTVGVVFVAVMRASAQRAVQGERPANLIRI
jgi:hypothetical protein